MKHIFLIPLSGLFFVLASCNFGPNSGRGFSLPEGDVAKGRATFVELECNGCHTVGDIEHIAGHEGLDINVQLGGQVTSIKTYGDLMTSVINPSYKAGWRYTDRNTAAEDRVSMMVVDNETMTVRQLVDLVTYLESNYQYVPPRRGEYVDYRVRGQ